MDFKSELCNEILEKVVKVKGKKALFIQKSISGCISTTAEASLFRENGVSLFLVFDEKPSSLPSESMLKNHSIILITSYFSQIIPSIFGKYNVEFHVIHFNPTPLIKTVLPANAKIHKIYIPFTIHKYFTLNLHHSTRFFSSQAITSSQIITLPLLALQSVYGCFPLIFGKGFHSQTIINALECQRLEMIQKGHGFPPRCEIDAVYFIDRSIDYVTPLCTPLTYDGLLDQVYGLDAEFIEYEGGKKHLNDKLYYKIRDLNFSNVGPMLSQAAKKLQDDIEARKDAKSIAQMKEFVGKIGGIESERNALKLHTSLAEGVLKYTDTALFSKLLQIQQHFVASDIISNHVDAIEDLIAKKGDFVQVLRLLCIYAQVNGGIKARQYETFKREIVHTYGIEHLLTIQNLERANLLFPAENINVSKALTPPAVTRSIHYQNLVKRLRLVTETDEAAPNDFSYMYSGYAPLSIRLLEAATSNISQSEPVKSLKGAWKSLDETLKLLPGPTVAKTYDNLFIKRNTKRKILVVFLGGCTLTEINALRFLSGKRQDLSFEVFTTEVTNSRKILTSFIEEMSKKPLDINQ